jgi:putative transposase
MTALLALAKSLRDLTIGGRGHLHSASVRQRVLSAVESAMSRGARLRAVCELIGLSTRTLQRWRKPELQQDRRLQRHTPPKNRLSDDERQHVLSLLRSEQYRALSPRKIVPMLADRGIYLASESTMYRLRRAALEQHVQAVHIHSLPSPTSPPERSLLIARAPHQIWSWDITYLRAPVRGTFYYLYLILDVFSRRIVAWKVHTRESARLASQLFVRTCKANGLVRQGIILRSDNGAAMRGATLLATLRRLGVRLSFSRPYTPNDNCFSESCFRTLKAHGSYPRQAFSSLGEARAWVARFVSWYNREHLHASLGYVSPDDRHFGREEVLLSRRQRVYEHARQSRPERWSHPVRRWVSAGPATLLAPRYQPGVAPRLTPC